MERVRSDRLPVSCRPYGLFRRATRLARGGCGNPSHSERLFFVIDALSRWPDVCWFGVTRSELITNRTNHDLRRPSFVLVPPACGVIGGERHVIHATGLGLCFPYVVRSCSGVKSQTSLAVAYIAHISSSGANRTRARLSWHHVPHACSRFIFMSRCILVFENFYVSPNLSRIAVVVGPGTPGDITLRCATSTSQKG